MIAPEQVPTPFHPNLDEMLETTKKMMMAKYAETAVDQCAHIID